MRLRVTVFPFPLAGLLCPYKIRDQPKEQHRQREYWRFETQRHWEQGEDPSMLDPKLQIYGKTGKLVVADRHEREEWRKLGFRKLMRATKLTQKAIKSILRGDGVRPQTMRVFRIGAKSLSS